MSSHAHLAEQHAESAGQALGEFHRAIDEVIRDLGSDEDSMIVNTVRHGVTALVETGLSIGQRIADATRH